VTLQAIYENGTLKLSQPLPLPEKSEVHVTVETADTHTEGAARREWLKASEERLTQTLDNPDDIFNELLRKSER
jgi:predicted DNA-binding antitoxin AbrB/MazE fold protein